MNNERLPVILFVTTREEELLNRRVPGILKVAIIKMPDPRRCCPRVSVVQRAE